MKSLKVMPQKRRRSSGKRLSEDGYRQLADFRYTMRQFFAFSEKAAHDAGLTPQQHQALLAVKGLSVSGDASVGDIAQKLLIRHHSAVELVDRLVRGKLVKRTADPQDGRKVFVSLTAHAERLLEALSADHLQELQRVRPQLVALLEVIDSKRAQLKK